MLDRLAGRAAFSAAQKRLELFSTARYGARGAAAAPARRGRRAAAAAGELSPAASCAFPEIDPDVEPDPACSAPPSRTSTAHGACGSPRRENRAR